MINQDREGEFFHRRRRDIRNGVEQPEDMSPGGQEVLGDVLNDEAELFDAKEFLYLY